MITVRFVLRTAIVAAGIGSIPPAIAGEGGSDPNTLFAQPPAVIAQPQAQNIPPAQAGQALQAGRGPWLFPPIGKYLDQQARG